MYRAQDINYEYYMHRSGRSVFDALHIIDAFAFVLPKRGVFLVGLQPPSVYTNVTTYYRILLLHYLLMNGLSSSMKWLAFPSFVICF